MMPPARCKTPGPHGVEDDLDKEQQRLEHLFHYRIEPRIIGTRMLPVPLENGRRALVIRIPKSWNPPHAALDNQRRLIFARNSAGVHEASVDEMRSMFTAGATLLERSREFQQHRMREIHSGAGPGPDPFGGDGGRMVLHIIPFSSFGSEALDLRLVSGTYLPPIWFSGIRNSGYNADGYYTTDNASGCSGYVQVFRNGIIESAVGDVRAKLVLHANNVEYEIASKVAAYMSALSRAEVAPPMFIMLGGVRVHGTMVAAGARPIATQPPLGTSDWILPAVMIEDYGQKEDYCQALKPMFDAIWNAAGDEGSPSYGAEGKWTRTR
jgi:hypothetical protein